MLGSLKKEYTAYLIAFVVLLQNPIWPLWDKGYGLWIGYFCVLLIFLKKSVNFNKCIINKNTFYLIFVVSILLIIFFLFPTFFYKVNISILFIILTFITCFFLKDQEKQKALRIVTKSMAVIVAISLPAWLLHLFVWEFPLYEIIDISGMKGKPYFLNNHIFFVTYEGLNYFRFYSVFDEPGVLGTLSAFLLFGNKYNFSKWENFILLLGGIFTYSMSFYVLTLFGYLYYSLHSLRKCVYSFSFLIVILITAYYLLKDDLAFQLSVLDRFVNFPNGIDDRTSDNIAVFYEKYIYSFNSLIGVGKKFMVENDLLDGASYKIFLIEYGYIGLLLLVLMYFSLLKKVNKNILFFCVFFFLSFLQRPYAFTSWQIFIFVCIISTLSNEYKSKLPV